MGIRHFFLCHSRKMHLLAHLGLFTDRNTDFATISNTPTREIPALSYT